MQGFLESCFFVFGASRGHIFNFFSRTKARHPPREDLLLLRSTQQTPHPMPHGTRTHPLAPNTCVLPAQRATGLDLRPYLQSWERRSVQIHCPPPPSISLRAMKLIISFAKIGADVLREAQSPSTCGTGGASPLEQAPNKWTSLPFCPLRIVFLGLRSYPSLQLPPLTFLTPAAIPQRGLRASPQHGTAG